MNVKKEQLLLYGITDRHWLKDETLYQQVEKALKGGVTFIQLREKTLDDETFIKEALKIKELCKSYKVPLIINDRVDIAKKIDADGVHIGQGDMNIKKAREILGKDKIIGVTAKTIEQATLAEKMGADYLGTGAVFSTNSKSDAKEINHETFKEICSSVNIPVVAIGGITGENILSLKGYGMAGVAVISAIFSENDIESATKTLKEKVKKIV